MNLAHYLGSGIIAPSIYIENKNSDIQDRFSNYLLISTEKFTIETNCSIEIVLNNDDEFPEKISERFYLLQRPLPISRIKGVYFTNEEQKISTSFNITAGTAFIPEGLLKVSKEAGIETKELEGIEYKKFSKDWSVYLKKYDQILGGFSSMKISKRSFQSYPTHYFSALGNINRHFGNILAEQGVDIENNFQFAFTNEGKFGDFQNAIYSEIDFGEVKRFAEKDKVKLEVKNGIIQIENIPDQTQTYLLAILESYGKNKRKQIDSFVSDLISGKFIEKKKEGLSLIFGLNKGYKAFRNKYKTQNFEINVKFKLESRLDYYIIESIFQYVFNLSNLISSFKYIDELVIDNKVNQAHSSNYIFYKMIDEQILWKERSLSQLEKLLEVITQKVRSWFPSFVDLKKSELEKIFKNELESFQLSIEESFKTEINNNKNLIEKLELENSKKDEVIANLSSQISTEKSKIMAISAAEKKSIMEESEPIYGELFSDKSSISVEQTREIELNRKKIPSLKSIAEQYKIKKISSLNKSQLIKEILNYEFKQ